MTRRSLSPTEPLVERNQYRQRGRIQSQIPDFEEVRPRLPVPLFPEDPGWEKLYWSAWDDLWGRFRLPPEGSSLIAGFTLPKPGGNIELSTATLVTQLSGYIPGTFSLIDFLDNFYAVQHDDGFICREVDSETGEDLFYPFEPNSTGPNLLAFAEWRHFRLTGDKERIAEVFWPLIAYHRWCRANRTWPNGLYWTTGYASSLINQPRVPGGRYHHRHWAWIDASAQAALSCTLLERMAVLLGEQDLAEEVAAERAILHRAITADMWNSATSFYHDVDRNGRFSSVKSIAAYWALMDGQLVPKERVAEFVQHLRDSWSFRVPHVLPSLSADSEAYNGRTGNGWRGAVWPSLTYMVLRGLKIAENHMLAHQLALNHVDTVCRVFESTGDFWENYLPEAPGPAEPANVDQTGKTPSAVIAMLLEDVLGISVDWPLRQVTWRRYLERERTYGVKNLPLGNEGTLDLLGDGETVHIRTDVPFTFTVYQGQDVVQTAMPAGDLELSLE